MFSACRAACLAAPVFGAVACVSASAATISVDFGKDPGGQFFHPDFIRILPGDKVRFRQIAAGGLVQSIRGMLPQGASQFAASVDRDLEIQFEHDGVYGVQYANAYQAGGVVLVVVGKPVNELAAKAVQNPPLAQARFDKLFSILDGN